MQITRFGHAAVLVESSGRRILVDPGVFSSPAVFELDHLDAVVVTHQHPDHLDRDRVGVLVAANPEALLLADPMSAGELGGPWQAHTDGDRHEVGDLVLRGAGRQHAEILPSLPIVDNVGLVVTAPGEPTFFHPGDSYATTPEDVDVLALPLGAPWAKVSETVEFLQRIAPRVAFPVHDCTISALAYDIYWNHVVNHGGVDDVRRLDQTAGTEVLLAGEDA
ncbi:MAG: MBL fold metallo-hydrolase [Aeromicrobium sp.]|uniref:MBL fold metallo-hydrolase n=1 Tax=Aeromicrobium sp. TaxID=1871063 RepID=UPI00261C07C0|nr:MBL fold metallo-hydrolase [Aeromicrobium sp.]MDF1705098.1 MBL fold metallo-hydrolase [Aeromicrobium sp.]